MEKITWTGRVKNEELLCNVKEENNSLHEKKRGRLYWIDHI